MPNDKEPDPFSQLPTVAPPRASYGSTQEKSAALRRQRAQGGGQEFARGTPEWDTYMGGGMGPMGPENTPWENFRFPWQGTSVGPFGEVTTRGGEFAGGDHDFGEITPTPVSGLEMEVPPAGGPGGPVGAGGGGDVSLQMPSGGSIGGPGAGGAIPGGDLMALMRAHATGMLENPSRFNDELVQRSLDAKDAELAEKRRVGERDLEEFATQRGLVGSSVELEQRAQLTSELERERSQHALDLAMEQARTAQQDKALAAQVAQGVLGEDTARWHAQTMAELQARGLDIQEATAKANIALANRAHSERVRANLAREGIEGERLAQQDRQWQTEFEAGQKSDAWNRWFMRKEAFKNTINLGKEKKAKKAIKRWLSDNEEPEI